MALSFSGPTGNQPKVRNPLGEYLKAVNDQLAERESVGAGPTPYLLQQKAELEAALGLTKKPEPEPKPEPKPEVKLEAELERKDAEAPAETVVPRGPGRPRKPDATSGS